MSPQVKKITVMLGKLVVKASMSRNDLLFWTPNDLLNIANGSSLIKNESSREVSFGKKIKIHQLYEYIKSIREYVYNRHSTVVRLPLRNMRKYLFRCKSFE